MAAGGTDNPKAPNTALVAARGKAITRARDLVGKTIAVDGPNTIAHLGVLERPEKSGVDGDDVKITFIPFAQMLGALAQGTIDAALVPEPWRTLALQQGAKHVAYPWNAVCAQTCVLAFWISPADVDPNLAARLRNAIQNAAVWANQRKNDEVSGKILAKYVPIPAAVLKKITRTTYSTPPLCRSPSPGSTCSPSTAGYRPRSSRATSSSSVERRLHGLVQREAAAIA